MASGRLAEMVQQKREAEGEETPKKVRTKAVAKVNESGEEKTVQTVIGSDGTVEQYDDPFASVTEEQVEEATKLQNQILDYERGATLNYLKMARDLMTFKNNKLYLAKGYENFQTWAESPELASVGWRTAYNLVVIAEKVLPLLQAKNLLDEVPNISHLYSLLPTLNDENGEEKFIEAMRAIKGKSSRDASLIIREIRGIPDKVGERKPTLFRAKARRQGEYYIVTVTADDRVDFYTCGELGIKQKDWARFEKQFGERNIEIVE